jgi:hypothetical protein
MKRPAAGSWPPLIVVSDKPRWVAWRDATLTLAMWVLLAIMLETEFELFFGRYLEKLGLGDFDTQAHWARFFRLLEPYVWLIVMLCALLAASCVRTQTSPVTIAQGPEGVGLPTSLSSNR